MENLTESFGVLKPNVAPVPRQGYRVVIFKEKKDSKTLYKILNEDGKPSKGEDGKPIKTGFLSLNRNYVAYAVNANPNLSFDRSSTFMLPTQHKNFTLSCRVYFQVSNPGPLAVRFRDDPLRLIWNEMESQFRVNIKKSKITIDDVKSRFDEIEDIILSEKSLKSIRHIADNYGISIEKIVMHHTLSEGDLELDKAGDKHDVEKALDALNKEKAKAKREEELEAKAHELMLKRMESASEAINKTYEQFPVAVEQLAKNVDNPEKFTKSMDAFMGVVREHFSTPQNLGNPRSIPIVDEMQKNLDIGESGSSGDLRKILMGIMNDIRNSGCNNEDKREMLAIVTQIMGETYREEKADFEVIEQQLKRLERYTVEHRKIFTLDRIERIKRFRTILEDVKTEFEAAQ